MDTLLWNLQQKGRTVQSTTEMTFCTIYRFRSIAMNELMFVRVQQIYPLLV